MDVDEIPTLYRTWGGELWRALLSVSGGRSDLARDATSEAFARLVANAQSVREPRAWLYRTGYRVVVDELRRERRDRPAAASEAALDEYPSLLSGRLREAFALLTPEQRLAVFLAYQADLPLGEVARLSGCSVAAVRVRLHRARRAIRGVFDEGEAVNA